MSDKTRAKFTVINANPKLAAKVNKIRLKDENIYMQTPKITSKQKLHFQIENNLLFIDKASGFLTQSSLLLNDSSSRPLPQLGMANIFEHILGQKIFKVHTVEQQTTGCLLFALNAAKAADISTLFEEAQVQMKYIFLTDRFISKETFELPSLIKTSGTLSLFQRIKSNSHFSLWTVQTKSENSQQILLQAALAGIPVLGYPSLAPASAPGAEAAKAAAAVKATEAVVSFSQRPHRNGQDFPHPCLHLQEIQIPGEKIFSRPPPIFFERMGLLRDERLCRWLSAFDRRQRLFDFLHDPNLCLRLSHKENLDFKMDAFGPLLWIYWYKEEKPNLEDLERFEFIEGLIKKKVLIRRMQNRGKDPLSRKEWEFSSQEETHKENDWIAEENLTPLLRTKYLFKKNQSLSPGLFLDQKPQRQWLFEKAKTKKILNLFSYTGSFSVSAALGGASSVTTVDLSKNYLEWSKENFKLNGFSIEKKSSEESPLLEFYCQDAFDFLKLCEKKNRKFDIIIIDPPSFSRNGKKTFQIEKDFPKLIQSAWSCLGSSCLDRSYIENKAGKAGATDSPIAVERFKNSSTKSNEETSNESIRSKGANKAYLLISCNYEKWTLEDFKKIILSALTKSSVSPSSSSSSSSSFSPSPFVFESLPISSLDYELPGSDNPLLKCLIISRNL